MKTNKSKRGISLIVLVITIVVMIILAAAIILSLNSSNISSRASEARTTSDLSNKKEAASVYLSEYEINLAKGKINSSTTANAYVKEKLKKAGIDTSDVYVTDNKDIYVGIAALLVNQNVPIGAEVKGYKLNNTTTYKTSGKENTANASGLSGQEVGPESNTITREAESQISWQYMGIDENGEALIVRNVTANSPKMILTGKGGYANGPEELNNACKELYSSTMGTARSIDIDDVVRVLGYNGTRGAYSSLDASYKETTTAKTIGQIAADIGYDMDNFGKNTPDGKDIGSYKSDAFEISSSEYSTNGNLIYPSASDIVYWLASRCVQAMFWPSQDQAMFGLRVVYETSANYVSVYGSSGNPTNVSATMHIRPVVALTPSVQIASYDSTNKVVTLK